MSNKNWIALSALFIAILVLLFGDNLVERLTGCSIKDTLLQSCSPPDTITTSQGGNCNLG